MSEDQRIQIIRDIRSEIVERYESDEDQRVADKCLAHADEWLKSQMSAAGTEDVFRRFKKPESKRECYRFVKDKVAKEYRQEYGSVVSFLLIYVILPVILKWIVERLFTKLVERC